eukprot:3834468-Pyramimonas_sp.AAC.1
MRHNGATNCPVYYVFGAGLADRGMSADIQKNIKEAHPTCEGHLERARNELHKAAQAVHGSV